MKFIEGISAPTAVNVCPKRTNVIEINRIPSRQLRCSDAPGSLDGRVILKSLLVFEYTLKPISSCFQPENKKVRYELLWVSYA